MDKDEIATLNEAYAKIADIPKRVKEAQAILAKDFEFEQDYYNPLHCYDDEKLLIELRDKLIKFVIGTITKGVNYEINDRDIFEHLNLFQDFFLQVVQYLYLSYLHKNTPFLKLYLFYYFKLIKIIY